MTTDRPYRHRRPANEVIDDLKRNSGKQFAPELVSAFLKGMFRELTGETKDKRFRRLLGREYMEAENILPILKTALNGSAPKPITVLTVDQLGSN
jgi:HD-GYP domain-containing protein (c-di-GMP phosphodiesterase class II)